MGLHRGDNHAKPKCLVAAFANSEQKIDGFLAVSPIKHWSDDRKRFNATEVARAAGVNTTSGLAYPILLANLPARC